MDNEILKILSEELRETKKLVLAAQQQADASMIQANAAMKKADAAWELVVIAREELKEMRKPFWKRWFGK